jgi:TM2 domain-containing membrane protein YozV/DNA uptake protein ComE-like DNA-binding protein
MRNKIVAVFLAFFFGYFGAHKFYLGSFSAGIFYLYFSWTFIPAILSLFDFIKLIITPAETFEFTYNKAIAPGGNNNIVPQESAGERIAALSELQKLYDNNMITVEEFEDKRRNILDLIYPQKSSTNSIFSKIKMPKSNHIIDINNCSKDELVRTLEIPIIYANNIESLKNEGYIFTHMAELLGIAGMPESYLGKLAGKVIFTYNTNKEMACSWQRLNVMSIDELVMAGLSGNVAQKIVTERENNGEYRSVIDIKRRTNIPFHSYKIVVQQFPYS